MYMNAQSKLVSPELEVKKDPFMIAKTLGEKLRHTSEFDAFLAALKVVNADPDVRRLGAQRQKYQNDLRRGMDDAGQSAAELARVELEMEELPVVKTYRQAEEAVTHLFRSIDEIISQEARVPFAVNAKRGGCCG
jgi:cell fate (sporulation/competence/biofilm development) regulator YlbF (YheA/YmcA/DUF963 family)